MVGRLAAGLQDLHEAAACGGLRVWMAAHQLLRREW